MLEDYNFDVKNNYFIQNDDHNINGMNIHSINSILKNLRIFKFNKVNAADALYQKNSNYWYWVYYASYTYDLSTDSDLTSLCCSTFNIMYINNVNR